MELPGGHHQSSPAYLHDPGGHSMCDEDHEQQIDNSASILEKIASLYAERLLSDIILEVGSKTFAAHRLILCASSDVFQVMLMCPNWSESQENHIQLQEEPRCVQVFPEFLKYLYTGKVLINHEQVLPLLILADKYNIKDLVVLGIEYMNTHIVKAAKHGILVSWLQYSMNVGHVVDIYNDFIAWNFDYVSQMEDFVNFESEVLVTFLQKSNLVESEAASPPFGSKKAMDPNGVVKDEFSLFLHVSKWLMYHENKLEDQQFQELVPSIMKYIRFPMMSPRQLANLLLNPLVINFKEFFVNQMSLAMAFHSNQILTNVKATESRSQPPIESNICTPRLYSTEKWSSSLIIENYRSLPTYGMRTLVFMTPSSLSEFEPEDGHISSHNSLNTPSGDAAYEWAVDLHPKGVWFKQFFLIRFQGTIEMPEWVCKTVRLTLTVKFKEGVSGKVSIGVLIHGKQDGIDYVKSVVQRDFHFTDAERMCCINDLMPFEQLNPTAGPSAAGPVSNQSTLRSHPSSYLTGLDNDTLKLQIVVTPLC